MAFIGRYYHALEQKGRTSVPKKFRSELSDPAYITIGLEGCLFLYPHAGWQRLLETLSHLPFTSKAARDWTRLVTQNAAEVSFDSLGRILIPSHLIQAAGLQKQLVIAGSLSHIEIWDQQKYHTYLDTIIDQAATIAEAIGEIK